MRNSEVLRERLERAARDPEAFYDLLHEDVEWDLSDSLSPIAGVYHGREAVRDFYRRWAGAFNDWSFDIERVVERDNEVVLIVREHGHGRGSGAKVEMRRANVWTFERGKVVRFRSFSSPDAALRAAGADAD